MTEPRWVTASNRNHAQAIKYLCPEIITLVTGLTSCMSLVIAFRGVYAHNYILIWVGAMTFFELIYYCARALYNRDMIVGKIERAIYENSHYDIMNLKCRQCFDIELEIIDRFQKNIIELYVACSIICVSLILEIILLTFVLF
jgi:hypothetical protein